MKIQLERLTDRIRGRNISVSISPRAEEALSKEGYDPHYGARPLRRIIQSKILNPLAEEIISGRIKEGEKVKVDYKGDGFVIDHKKHFAVPFRNGIKKLKVAVK